METSAWTMSKLVGEVRRGPGTLPLSFRRYELEQKTAVIQILVRETGSIR